MCHIKNSITVEFKICLLKKKKQRWLCEPSFARPLQIRSSWGCPAGSETPKPPAFWAAVSGGQAAGRPSEAPSAAFSSFPSSPCPSSVCSSYLCPWKSNGLHVYREHGDGKESLDTSEAGFQDVLLGHTSFVMSSSQAPCKVGRYHLDFTDENNGSERESDFPRSQSQ